ncbi:Hypothetical protein, putative [Bodo saltans]|uniref:Mic1 domain-containing protein n=1 Tax=Bodo saltans TaxID=75058 RepID=A0A0S4IUY7_BODSA|nr:Hypothetical protein, putative [Bodo saltans]|eukprot:CUG14164.1 Hypothetical protein, putative [Bodo saltans]
MDPKARSRPSTDVVGFSGAANIFIDEDTDDLIAVYPGGEIYIFRLDLRASQSSSTATGRDVEALPWVGDTVHLLTGKDEVQIVKCSALPNRLQTSFMVAVCHNDEEICFYLPPSLPPTAAATAPPGSSKNSSGGAVTKSFAQHVCAPRNLRFRNRFYPIRSMWWMESRHFPSSPPPTSSSATQRPAGGNSGSGLQRHGSQQRKFLLVMTQISVEMLSVAEELYGNEASHVVLINRISTRVDYWSFLSSGQLRCAIAINESKLSICKPFVVERSSVLTTMPQLTLEGLPTSTDGFVSPLSSSHMDCPRLQLQVQPVVLYDSLFVLHVTAQRSVVLHRYVSERSKRAAAMDAGGETSTSSPNGGEGGNTLSSAASGGDPLSNSNTSLSQFQGGAFEPYAVLSFGSVVTPVMLSLELLRFHVIDNALIVHLTHCRQTVVFDIASGPAAGNEGPFTGNELFSRAASEANVSEGASGNNASMSSAAYFSSFVSSQSAASQQRFFDPASGSATPRDRSASPGRPSPRGGGSWMNRLVSWTAGTGAGGPVATREGARATRMIGPTTSFSLEDTAPTPHASSSREVAELDDENQPQQQLQQSRSQCAAAAFVGDVYASYEFYNGWLPLAVDRQRGDVRMFFLDVEALATRIADIPQRVQFLLNRRFCNPNAVTLLVRDLILDQEGLPNVAQSLDAICSTNLRVAQAKARRGAMRGSNFKKQWTKPPYVIVPEYITPIRCGSAALATHVFRPLPLSTADEVWGHVKTTRKTNAALRALVAAQWDDAGSQRHNTDQMSIYRCVFGPLAHKAAAANQRAGETAINTEEHITQQADDLGNKNRYNGSVYFANYVLNVLLEYTRSLIQHGETLADATQRCVVNMFLQQPQPDFFRLHQLLMYRAIDDHIPTALQLITLERQYPPALQMGLDMLARLNATNEIVQVLLARQTPLLAAKFVVSSRFEPPNVLADILHCSALLCEHDRPAADNLPSILPSDFQFYTIYSLFTAHFPDAMNSASFAPFVARFRSLTM